MARASVLVQRLGPADAGELFALIDRNREWLSRFGDDVAGHYPTLASVRDRIDKPPLGVLEYRCGIRDAETRQLLGFIQLTVIPGLYRVLELGYWLGEEFTDQGYMTKAVRFITNLALTEFEALEVRAWVHPENEDSQSVLRRARFTENGPDPDRNGLVRFSINPADAERLS